MLLQQTGNRIFARILDIGFFPYNIPPLQERKGDILYYFNEIFPELTKASLGVRFCYCYRTIGLEGSGKLNGSAGC